VGNRLSALSMAGGEKQVPPVGRNDKALFGLQVIVQAEDKKA
jgi:hypothetical protein